MAASSSALREIDQAVMEAYYSYHAGASTRPPYDPLEALHSLRRVTQRPAQLTQNRLRLEPLQRSLDGIYRLIHARSTELANRDDEFRSASLRHAVAAPDAQALGRWLRSEADAAPDAVEKSYFAHLAQELSRGRDPWTVSREFIGSLPGPGNAGDAKRLRVARARLVQAMAGNPLQPAALPTAGEAQAVLESRAPASMRQEVVAREKPGDVAHALAPAVHH